MLHLPECFRIIFRLGLGRELAVTRIVASLSTVVACNMIQVCPGSLIFLVSVFIVVPSFLALRKHELVADPVVLIISIRIIIRLII